MQTAQLYMSDSCGADLSFLEFDFGWDADMQSELIQRDC